MNDTPLRAILILAGPNGQRRRYPLTLPRDAAEIQPDYLIDGIRWRLIGASFAHSPAPGDSPDATNDHHTAD